MVIQEYIPVARMGRFHEILLATDGRYLRNPLLIGETYQVDYEPGNYAEQSVLWQRYITPIREVRRDQWWRRALRRLRPGL